MKMNLLNLQKTLDNYGVHTVFPGVFIGFIENWVMPSKRYLRIRMHCLKP
jgi:hypothetical protein